MRTENSRRPLRTVIIKCNAKMIPNPELEKFKGRTDQLSMVDGVLHNHGLPLYIKA